MDGTRGVELAREIIPRAIILDVLMPGIDGWSVLTAIKSDPRLADVPVIMASIVEDKNLGFALGAADFLTKPIERSRLLSVLRKFECDLRQCRVMILKMIRILDYC
jgi:CheY-like chemotaxis protein